MAITLNIDLMDLPAREALADLSDKSRDLTPLMEMCGALLERSTKDRLFDTNTAPDGVAWPPSLRAQEDGGKTLVASARLANSIQYLAGNSQVEIGSNVIYAGIHQTGGEIRPKTAKALGFRLPNGAFVSVGKVTIPARPYLGISEEDADDITDAVGVFLDVERVQ